MLTYCSKFLKVFGLLRMAHVRTFHPNKPPNVMVYADRKNYAYLEKNLFKCLPTDKYIIYHLTSVDTNNLWKENTSLLIIFSDAIDSKINDIFLQYVKNGGKLLAFCSNLSFPNITLEDSENKECIVSINYENICDVAVFRGKYSYKSTGSEIISYDNNNKSVIYKTFLKGGICIISEVHLAIEPVVFRKDYTPLSADNEKHLNVLKNILFKHFHLQEIDVSQSVPSLTPGYIMTKDDKSLNSLMNNLKIAEIPVDKFSQYLFSEEEKSDAKPQPIIPYNLHSPKLSFDKNFYFSKLKTKNFGHQLLYFPVIHTTMIANLFPDCNGLVIVAGEQLAARGRGGNKWIGSEGCAMFTLHVSVPLSSYLGQHLSILQHVPALAVVHSIKSLEGYDELNLNIKWPNDIYFGKECKIGGVLLNSTIQNNLAHAYMGIAINVSNSHPTTCLNDIIKSYNASNSKTLKGLKIEEVIAYTLNNIEYFVNDLNKSGPSFFLSLYYSSWMHQKQRVRISSANEEGEILGIDEYGFLVVETDGGQKLVLQPDGNSFDIMKNLISLK